MNELIATTSDGKTFQHQLLTTVSTLALVVVAGVHPVLAGDSQRPTVWIELGGQLERISGQGDPFTPPFVTTYADSPGFSSGSPIVAQKSPRYSKGLEGKLSFAPQGSEWIYTAALRYGRANGGRRIHQQTAGLPLPTSAFYHSRPGWDPVPIKAFSDVRTKDAESHFLLDFTAGKEVGFGALGHGGDSTFSFGIRFAQFTSDKSVQMNARPEIHLYGALPAKYWSNFAAAGHSERSFQGLGPSVSWNGSAALTGTDEGGITLDWGAGGAILFGRQKANVTQSVSETKLEMYNFFYSNPVIYDHSPPRASRRHSLVVPNIGGSVGLSFRRQNAKISFGYRADFFFGAMDAGIDTRKTSDVSFHGPFAAISIGLGG